MNEDGHTDVEINRIQRKLKLIMKDYGYINAYVTYQMKIHYQVGGLIRLHSQKITLVSLVIIL